MISVNLLSRGPWINWVNFKLNPAITLFLHWFLLGLVVFSTIVFGCSAAMWEGHMGLPHWGHANVNIPDSWVKICNQKWVCIHFLFYSIWRTMSGFSETSESPATSPQQRGARSAASTWSTTTSSLRRLFSWGKEKERDASRWTLTPVQDLQA